VRTSRHPHRRAQLQAAGQVSLATDYLHPAVGRWGTGIHRLAAADFPLIPEGIFDRQGAMSIPTISRARNLIISSVAALPLTLWTLNFNSAGLPIEQAAPPSGWMARPDPNRTRQHLLGWTTDDLFFHGRAYWKITKRSDSSTYPTEFQRMPITEVTVRDDSVYWGGEKVLAKDVVEFLSPNDGLLYVGQTALSTAQNLESAANRFSLTELPAGWLEQTEGEPLDGAELEEIATTFQAARRTRTVAALNAYMRWKESGIDPSKLQLTEARAHQALELSRLANVPSYLTGAPSGTGMTYQNTAQAKADLLDFGSVPFVGCIEQTLSGPNVTPRTQFVRLDLNAWLRNPFVPNENASPNDAQLAFNPNQPPTPDRSPGRPRDVDGLNEASP
jgi:phage portal protein BeeE